MPEMKKQLRPRASYDKHNSPTFTPVATLYYVSVSLFSENYILSTKVFNITVTIQY